MTFGFKEQFKKLILNGAKITLLGRMQQMDRR